MGCSFVCVCTNVSVIHSRSHPRYSTAQRLYAGIIWAFSESREAVLLCSSRISLRVQTKPPVRFGTSLTAPPHVVHKTQNSSTPPHTYFQTIFQSTHQAERTMDSFDHVTIMTLLLTLALVISCHLFSMFYLKQDFKYIIHSGNSFNQNVIWSYLHLRLTSIGNFFTQIFKPDSPFLPVVMPPVDHSTNIKRAQGIAKMLASKRWVLDRSGRAWHFLRPGQPVPYCPNGKGCKDCAVLHWHHVPTPDSVVGILDSE